MTEFKVIQKIENLLLSRREIVIEIKTESAPSNKAVEEFLCKEFSATSDAVRIKKVAGEFGKKLFKVNANIYSSKEALNAAESKTKKERETEKKTEAEKAE